METQQQQIDNDTHYVNSNVDMTEMTEKSDLDSLNSLNSLEHSEHEIVLNDKKENYFWKYFNHFKTFITQWFNYFLTRI
jgi:hypothetical protein